MSQGNTFTTSHKANKQHNLHQPMIYQIGIQGGLGSQWQAWFEGLTITLEEADNVLPHFLIYIIAALSTNSSSTVLEDVAHSIHHAQPQVVIDAISDILAQSTEK